MKRNPESIRNGGDTGPPLQTGPHLKACCSNQMSPESRPRRVPWVLYTFFACTCRCPRAPPTLKRTLELDGGAAMPSFRFITVFLESGTGYSRAIPPRGVQGGASLTCLSLVLGKGMPRMTTARALASVKSSPSDTCWTKLCQKSLHVKSGPGK